MFAKFRHYLFVTFALMSFSVAINNANATGCNVITTTDLNNIGYSLNGDATSSGIPIYTGYNQLQCNGASGDITQSISLSLGTSYLNPTNPPTWMFNQTVGNGNPTVVIANSSLTSFHVMSSVTISNNDLGDTLDIYNSTIGNFTNDGIIVSPSSGASAIWNMSNSTISSFTNNGTIDSVSWNGIANAGTINSLINLGSISGYTASIVNTGTITSLDNAQGKTSTPLRYDGNLPANYYIIARNHSSDFGQLSVLSSTGTMNFGISNLSARASSVLGTYINVISGVPSGSSVITNSTATTSNGYTYALTYDNINSWWDLNILSYLSGPSSTDTQSALHALAPKLRSGFNSQAIATNFANMNTYDCDLFDSNGVCVSVGGQQTYLDNPSSNMTSTVVVAGYKVSPQIRIGGFLNQNINNNTLSGVHISNANPLMGLFAVWNQNEDRLGYQVKIANAYQDIDVTTTRDVIGTSEAGTGSTTLNTQSYVGELSYAFLANEDKTLVRPYAAIRYTRIKQDGYTESSSVSTPLSYAALADRSTTALVGVKLNHKLAGKVNLTGSLGIEQDIDHHVDNLTATGVSGLTSENFNDSIKRTRPVASIGAYYMPVKNQRISADVYYQQLPFQSTGAATAYVNYTIGF